MNHETKGFLSRWSQRKVQVRQGGVPVAAEAPLPVAPAAAAPVVGEAGLDSNNLVPPNAPANVTVASGVQAPAADATRPPPPTLEDVQALTPESDFSRFMARDVDPQVKNSAMKKLFADPHYNVMDRLDTYIDDYNKADPIPKAMFKQLVQARMLGLLDDELEDQIPPVPDAAIAVPAAAQEPADLEAAAEVALEVEVEGTVEGAGDGELLDAALTSGQDEPPPGLAATSETGPRPGSIKPLKAV